MNNRKGLLLFILATFFCISHVEAIEFKPYVQVSPSLYNLDISLFNNDSKSTMLGGAIGAGIELYPWLAIEGRAGGSLANTGKLAGVSYDAQVQFPLLSVFAKPMLQFNDWYLYGLLGATVSPDYTLVNASGAKTTTKRSTALSLGLGAGYKISDSWTANLEVVQYHNKLGASDTLNAKLNGLGLVFNYYFDLGEEQPIERRPVERKPIEDDVPKPLPVEKLRRFDTKEVYYESSSAELSPAVEKQLDKVEALLREYEGKNLYIKGYSDSTGPEAYNLWLSAQRAVSVEEYLISKGVDVSRLLVMGFGEANPTASNATTKGRAQNRRVEIVGAEKVEVASKSKTILLRGVQFGLESSSLSSSTTESLDKLVKILKANPMLKAEVHGHTDTTGSVKYNLELSKKRASAVEKHLVSQGIEASRLSSVGYGGSKPIASNSTYAGRLMNRRVEVRLDD